MEVYGFDIDDTIAKSSEFYIKCGLIYDKKIRGTGIVHPEFSPISGMFDWTRDETKGFLKEYGDALITGLSVKEEAREAIRALKIMGKEIVLLSSRTNSYTTNPYSLTREWLKRRDVPYDKLLVESYDKASDASKLGVTVYMDDQAYNCEEVVEKGIKTYMMTTRYNKNKPVPKNVTRVNNWHEYVDEINKIM